MPLATAANVFTSSLSSSKLCTKVAVEEFHQGKISNETNRTSSSQFQRVSAMRDIKNATTENLESFTKLPNLRILEVLGATQPSKYIEPVAEKQSNNSSACIPMTVAVAEFKGPEVHGVVRFAQDSSGQQECSIETVIDGLAPGAHGWSVHEYGDLTRGPLSTGPAYTFPLCPNPSISQQEQQGTDEQLGNLGSLFVDNDGHVQSTATNNRLIVADIIGRSVVLYGVNNGKGDTRVAAAVIARSARPSSLNPQLCNCDGSLLWQGNANSC
ncbi:hypothetical protein KC19_2G049600 [Ceratodon purpureus]|uniref:Superoxide dismutase copper/zinc binding domain-containing protein n=1 Tax=Ceratodon purpureus TaxID=3225 RepID=A0A8T0IQA5_CERPU|nr:hypothetical protein KC19_2G049600 [Ceratodon purpureus]